MLQENHQKTLNNQHVPVLKNEVLELLDPRGGESYLDLTAGYGGHAEAIVTRIGKQGSAILIDRDQNAVDCLQKHFARQKHVTIVHNDFLSASRRLVKSKQRFDLILADLGVSSPHLDNKKRGFSHSISGPLDMRMDQRQAKTAGLIVNQASEAELTTILRKFGEVHSSKRIAQAICEKRPISSTTELAAIVSSAAPRRERSRQLTAQVFQGLRIATNDELHQLEEALPTWIELLRSGGRLVVISFHSLEDRLIKQAFLYYGGNRYDANLQILTKRPLTPRSTELVSNPRARSAKLRAAAKIKT